MTSRIELVPMSTAASRGGGGVAGPELGAARPVAAGTLVWAVALAMPPDLSWGGRNGAASPSRQCATGFKQRPGLDGNAASARLTEGGATNYSEPLGWGNTIRIVVPRPGAV